MALLEAIGIVKRFGGLLAVSEASLEAREGRITALIGPNGAGKTTLFAIIAGFLRADAGTVRFDGAPITSLAPHRVCRLGVVRTFQI
ncbi:MAG TPA: ATP-binding cassette domain-containing protein, partial [Burkholderiales bacterium]|nr:ATP-binding cassette domain-containing protein [Burkholderiales bacterium]